MNPAPPLIRPARDDDVAAMLDIYRPYVENTAVSFEESVPSLDEFAARVRSVAAGWSWLVAEDAARIVGYAYGSSHRERAAYRWSVETSVYVAAAAQRCGVGRRLYEALFARLAAAGYCNAYAGIALPNDASVALHRAVGFVAIGTFPRVGFKFGQWRDVAWFHRPLRAPEEPANA